MLPRTIEVDMSSAAIDQRLRTVSQLRKLGLSIAKAQKIREQEALKRLKSKQISADRESNGSQ